MSSVVISGNTSGTITLAAPDVAGTTTLTLPAVSGTLITSGGGYAGSFTTLTSTQDATLATSSGSVGIGTSSPIAKLDVRGAGAYFYDNSTTDFQLTVASSVSTIGTTTATPLAFKSNSTERLRIGTSGELGLSGANYGTSGQVIKSNGPGAAVSWGSATPSTADVQTAIAGSAAGNLGTTVWARPNTNAAYSNNDTVAGSTLINGNSVSCGFSGTWKAMTPVSSGGYMSTWLRSA